MKAVIIGAGVAGLATGWRLLQAGWQVTILERAQPGSGATGAAAGMLAITAELENAPDSERNLALQSNGLWPDFAKELEEFAGRPVGYSQAGTLILAANAADLERLRPRGTLIDADAVAAMVPGLAPMAGALWAADEAHVDPRSLARALTVAVLKAGGTILPNEAVVTIDHRDGRAFAVRTAFSRYGADAFLLAAGAWCGQLLDIPITPVKGEVIALAAPPDFDAPVIWGPGVYLVPRAGRLLVGATMQDAGFDTTLTEAARDTLRARAAAVIPASRSWPLADHWAGLRPKSPDALPLLGPSHLSNLFVAGGQYRNGILFTPAIGAHMAALMQGREAVIPAFDPRRFMKGAA